MSLIPNSIKNEWKKVAEQLNDNSGGLGVRCKLVFHKGIELDGTVPSDPVGKKPRTFLAYGGRSQASTVTGSESANEESSGLKQKLEELTIEARVYAVTKPFERFSLGVQDDKNIFRLITDKKFIPSLLSCKEIILNIDFPERRLRAKLMRPPIAYGLGQAVQCKSFWEAI